MSSAAGGSDEGLRNNLVVTKQVSTCGLGSGRSGREQKEAGREGVRSLSPSLSTGHVCLTLAIYRL